MSSNAMNALLVSTAALVTFAAGTASAAVTELVAIEDTTTKQESATTNFSTDGTVAFGAPGGGQARSALFRFDASSVASIAQVDIISVQLRLTLQSSSGNREGTVRALNDANADWTNAGASWDLKDGVNAWAGAGGARDAGADAFGVLGQIDLLSSNGDGEVFLIDLDPSGFDAAVDTWEELFDNWTDGTSNGLVLYNEGAGNTGEQVFYSSEDATASNRPTLIVTIVPEPGSLALLGLGGLAILRRRRN